MPFPVVGVVKTVSPPTRPAPGGDFSFGGTVTNSRPEPLTLDALVDDVYGDLAGKASCAAGGVVAPGASYECSFTGAFSGARGSTHTDTATATATATVSDDEDNEATPRPARPSRSPPRPPTATVAAAVVAVGRPPAAARWPAPAPASVARRLALTLSLAGLVLVTGGRRALGLVAAGRSYVVAQRRRGWGVRRQWPPRR